MEMVELPLKFEDDTHPKCGELCMAETCQPSLHLTEIAWEPLEEEGYIFPPLTDININMMPFIVG